jgi:hypothetical protein
MRSPSSGDGLVWPDSVWYFLAVFMQYDCPVMQRKLSYISSSVGDPHPHVFGPPGSGYVSQRYGSINELRGLKNACSQKI